MSILRSGHRSPNAFASDVRGVAATELALVAPLFIGIIVGSIDVARAILLRFNLNSSVTAAANYALVNASSVNSASGATLASNVANVAAGSTSSNYADASVVVNNGSAATITAGSLSASGTASQADSYYCPAISAGAVTWGGTQTAGASCANGGYAGKFVSIAASRAFSPSFLPSSWFSASYSVSAVVQVL